MKLSIVITVLVVLGVVAGGGYRCRPTNGHCCEGRKR
jgi:hypothetical protein